MTARNLIFILIFIGNLISLHAEEFRMWTESESKRQIEAKMIDKKLDGSEAKLSMRNGKSFWIKEDRLVEDDRDYVKNWVEPVDHISTRVVGFGKGKKSIEVIAIAGSKPLEVKAYWSVEGNQPIGYPQVFKLKKGERKTFTYKAGNSYIVKAWSEGELVDEEGAKTKTGL